MRKKGSWWKSASNLYIVLVLTLGFGALNISPVIAQSNELSSALSELQSKIVEGKIYNVNYETDSLRYLSTLVLKDSIVVFRNNFSREKYERDLKPVLLKIQQACSIYDYVAILGSNVKSYSTNEIRDHYEKTFGLLPIAYSFYNLKFYNLNDALFIIVK